MHVSQLLWYTDIMQQKAVHGLYPQPLTGKWERKKIKQMRES